VGCRGSSREPFVTYFNGEHGLSLRYPGSWKTEQAEQDGIWYRYFLAPPAGTSRKPAVSVTLLAGPLGGSLEEYAQVYLAGNTVLSSHDEQRQGARGKSYLFGSPDRAMRHSLLLLQEDGRVYGLYAQAEAALFDRHRPELDEMAKSLSLERAATYPEERNDKAGFSIRIPPSWRSARSFSGGGTFLTQFTSPPIGVDKDQTIHASLTVTVEPIPTSGDFESFYAAAREKQGDVFQLLSHADWRSGYVDMLRTETPINVTRLKRFYCADKGRGYTLSFETRDDVYVRVARWYDMIAATLKTASELQK
jgi:hypothetical protein